jgi:hypothetical protein
MTARFKRILLSTFAALYLSGVICWGLQIFGREGVTLFRETHSVVGMVFLIVLGYLLGAHVEQSWATGLKRPSGVANLVYFAVLILTVPFLFYASADSLRQNVILLHEGFGTFGIVVIFVHLKNQKKLRNRKRRRN